MKTLNRLRVALLASMAPVLMATAASAETFNIPPESLETALDAYSAQTGIPIMVANQEIKGIRTRGVSGNLSSDAALARILNGTGFEPKRDPSGSVGIARASQRSEIARPVELADAAPAHAAASVETVVVTSSKIKGDIQTVPIAITALSQEQLTSRQIAGGPDLVKEVPNLTFSKTNFSGYTIQIRGIGTQAISVTTDPAVAVALNDIPFIRNHFFEQEFFDVGQVEVLRGPQGTLYGRNATAGVVNVVTAKPTDQFEAMASADIGNYHNRRYEGMVNIPIVDDRLDLRVAGEWTKRDGYSVNALDGQNIDGRDLWSTRVTLGWKPSDKMQAYLVWEHFQESDDRMRTSKQLCKTDPGLSSVFGVTVPNDPINAYDPHNFLGQGCLRASLYSPEAFGVPNGTQLPYYEPLSNIGAPITAQDFRFDPYASTTQSRDLRVIESTIDPIYKAKNDTLELNVDYNVTPTLTFSSQTGYNQDFLWSTEDYNRFNTRPGAFEAVATGLGTPANLVTPDPSGLGVWTNSGSGHAAGDTCDPTTDGASCVAYGVYCDPQLGCSNRLVAQDLNDEHAWQLSQEFRLASNFSGPFNFSFGGNYLHYETDENYYVFINTLTMAAYAWSHGGLPYPAWNPGPNPGVIPGVSDNSYCIPGGFVNSNPNVPSVIGPEGDVQCMYIDPNPITSLNNKGHNYFLSQNPYELNSYAGFGEAYYNFTPDLKLTGGIRWTDDKKHFIDIPSELLVFGYGYPVARVVDQEWQKFTGRLAANWSPKLDFTDQTLIYGSYSRGYKAGGANPPGATLLGFGDLNLVTNPIHPLTFKPEFVDAYELGTKNTLLDGGLTLNGDVFFYNYTGYQISRIVDRTAINDNFNATVKGAELEAMWEPLPGLKFNFAGGYEDTRVKNGQSSIDLMDRTAGNPDWVLVKPFVSQASNCILPDYVVAAILLDNHKDLPGACTNAYVSDLDPVVLGTYHGSYYTDLAGHDHNYPYAIAGGYPGGLYSGFDPADPAIVRETNNGEGFAKNLSGNELPNAPHFTVSLSGDYTMPVSEDWAATLHSDFYWQSQSWARIFNDRPYDKIRGYSTTNLALILTSAGGWQVMGYVKNVFDVTAITGDFLNSDDSGLTTNVFLTDPRLYGVRVTKNW
jgi:iron complex outermembrane receptor protein